MDLADSILAACFWCCAAGVAYTYVGYPAIIWVCSRLFAAPQAAPVVADDTLPSVTLLVAAYNEADIIEGRIHNALSLNYPAGRKQVVIASDGSDDGTAELCLRHQGQVRTLQFPLRRGKAATLNAAIAQISTEIIVFSDANTSMDPDALLLLTRWFKDPKVGAVCGRLVLTDPCTGRNADGMYWRYETFIKRCEGRLGALLGANGAIYAIRREVFTPLPPGTVVDDFVIPLSAKLRSGCRIIYDPSAMAFEETAPDLGGEFRRRSRIGVGGYQVLASLWPLLSPRHGWTAFSFWSHKVMRWLCPFLLAGALITSLALARLPLYRAALIAQIFFYLTCAAGAILPPANRVCRVLRVFPLFAAMNFALMIGLIRGLRGRQTGIWSRTARGVQGSQAA